MKLALGFLCLVVAVEKVFCGCLCGLNPCGADSTTSNCGLNENVDMCRGGTVTSECVPLVVRPQEVVRPELPLPVGEGPVPGPCTYRKAIVRPAIVPKPVCNQGGDSQSIPIVNCCNGGAVGYNVNGGIGYYGGASSTSSYGFPEGCKPIDTAAFVESIDGKSLGTPADAVSLALALRRQQEMEACGRYSEDRLAFGFRKIPIELPKKTARSANLIPEESIHKLNGRVIEYKYRNTPGCYRSQTLEEEAAEGLMDLQEDDAVAELVGEKSRPLNGIYLEEMGYVPAKLPTSSFNEKPSISEVGPDDGNTGSSSDSNSNSLAGLSNMLKDALGIDANGSSSSRYVSGNVQYKTVAKPPEISLSTTPAPDSCESSEIISNGASENSFGGGARTSIQCMPVFVKKCRSAIKNVQENTFIQKLQL